VNRISDYALLGDCHSAALVGRDGSVDWACFPRFDSPAVLCRALDERGGAFTVTPARLRGSTRAYLDGTNVLVTTFETETGVLELTDCMPVRASRDRAHPGEVRPRRGILRRLRCVRGEVAVAVRVAPRYESGAFVPRLRVTGAGLGEAVGGADAIWVDATAPLQVIDETLGGDWQLEKGQEVWIEAVWTPSHAAAPDERGGGAMRRRLDETIDFWRGWLAGCRYEGVHADAVLRSALVLKALTYAPSGAVVAAPTTSLPEELGGERNWDYRYTWIRDATLTLISLFVLGFRDEAAAFKGWLERTGAGRPSDLQIMYGICGERFLPELELTHLEGHRHSRPVRIGNGAVKQLQLDCYGQLLNAAWLFGKAGGELTEDNWLFLSGLVDIVCERWREPDQGIWEIRDEPRHFTHSKVNCWVALDRAVRIATASGRPAPLEEWKAQRDALRDYLLEEAAADGWFGQAVGFPVADAATLLVPALGFLPSDHPLVLKTVEVVRRDLASGGLVHRYMAPDGVGGGEGAFLLCSFWLVDVLVHAGLVDEAADLLAHLVGLANDVGLFAEEADERSGEALGNFPQAFTHMALVTSCAHLSAARDGLLPTDGEPHDYAELALERLLAGEKT
jgi:GH15 family glucan-1,4-alpha-glucosidase